MVRMYASQSVDWFISQSNLTKGYKISIKDLLLKCLTLRKRESVQNEVQVTQSLLSLD